MRPVLPFAGCVEASPKSQGTSVSDLSSAALLSDDQLLNELLANCGSVLSPLAPSPAEDAGGLGNQMRQWQSEASRLWESRVESAAVTAKAASEAPKNSWQRRKLELQQLRDEVESLEAKRQRLTISVGGQAAVREREQRRHGAIAWRLRETWEQQRLQAAQSENVRLKELVQRHSDLARVLQHGLAQCTTSSLSLPDQRRLAGQVERTSVFDALVQKLERPLPEVGDVLKASWAQTSKESHHEAVKGNRGPHTIGNIRRARKLPFHMLVDSDALWQRAKRGFHDLALSSGTIEFLSNDALGVDVQVQVPELDGVVLRFRGVTKRLATTDDRAVLQFAYVTEWPSAAGRVLSVTEETAWAITRAVGPNAEEAFIDSSIESTLVASECGRTRRAVMTNTILPALHHVIRHMEQVIENALFDSLIGRDTKASSTG